MLENELISKFNERIKTINLNAYGVLDENDRIHTLGTDSKLIGRIFEMFAQPILEEIATEYGYIIETPEAQTVYPDFVLMTDKKSKEKIAIDIKTTYVEKGDSTIKFTLGAFGSYMRNNTKNIAYPYTDFSKHFVIGFVYMRNGEAQESKVFELKDRTKIACPYKNVRFFMQEKYKIAGDKPGSGNTENIGSFSTKDIDDLIKGKGPFSKLGPEIYDLYWKYYPKYRSPDKPYTNLAEFLKWLPLHINEVSLFRNFDKNKVIESIKNYSF